VLLAALAHGLAEAQPPADGCVGVEKGTRLRVTTASPPPSGGSGRVFVGRFAGSDRDELRLAVTSSESQALPCDAIVRIEQSVGASRKSRGALIGFGIGLGAMVGKVALQGGCNDGCNSANVLEAALVAVSTATLGAIAAPGERWAAVRLVPQVGRRTGLTLVASF
jgi:hypothetical protein